MKSAKLISIFFIFLIMSFDFTNGLKNFNIHKNIEQKVDHVYKTIHSSQQVFFANLRNMEKIFENDKIVRHLKKHHRKMEVDFLLNPKNFKNLIKDLYIDYHEFLDSEDHKNDHDEFGDHLHKISSNFENLSEIEKLEVKNYVNSSLNNYEKNVIFQILENSYIYNNNNFNVTSIIEMIPHYFADFKGEHKKPLETDKKAKVNSEFDSYLKLIEKEYDLKKLTNLTGKERRKHLENITKNDKHKKNYEGFSSFLTEYVHESVINNDQLFDRYLSNKEKHENNNGFDFIKIKEYLQKNMEIEEEKLENLNLKELIKSKRIVKPRFQQDNTTVTNENSTTQVNNTDNENNKDNQTSTDNNTVNQNKTQKQKKLDNSKKVFNKIKDNLGTIVGGQALQDDMKKAQEEEKKKIKIVETCDEKKMEQQVLEIVAKKEEEAKEQHEEAQKLMNELDPEIMENAGKPDGASNMMKKILTEFISKLVELLVKHIPFFFFKICVPPGPLTWECCPEAMFFPQQLYHLFTFKEKNEQFKVTAKQYPAFLHTIDKANKGKVFYYMCAQGYLSLLESTIWNFCNLPSLMFMNPMVLMGFIPGDLPLCMWACILVNFLLISQGMALCQTPMENFGPCDGLFNLETLIKAVFIVPLRLTLMNAMTKCTYIPFLVRWNLIPQYPSNDKPSDGNGDSGNGENKGNDENKDGNELNCEKVEKEKEKPSAFEEELRNLDPMNGEKIINDIKENTQIPEDESEDKILQPVLSKPLNSGKIQVDLSLERNFNPDEYIQILSSYMENDNHLADRFSETFGKFEIEEKFPLHPKRLIVSIRRENSDYETSTISGSYDY